MFRLGEIVVCIDNLKNGHPSLGLTYGKEYENIEYMGEKDDDFEQKWIHIINDRNESQSYRACRFVSVSEFRKMKINRICSIKIK